MTDKALPSGTRLKSTTDIYTIESVIGAGGFGITYKASVPTRLRNITSRAPIAIKEHFPAADCERSATTSGITFSSTASDRVRTSLREFIEEAQCLQRIAGLHPNIVTVNEVFEANNTAYYVMEYLQGRTLKQYVLEHGHLSAGETLSIMMPVIEAVATLHKNKFTHLDIKPSNIMLADDEGGTVRPVLIDFGLAKHYNPDGSATATLAVTGFSDGYAPIEQYSGITTFSPTVDVYSLGATILFCLTGKTPPRAVEVSPASINAMIPRDTPERLRNLIMVAMAFQSMDRLPNAQQLYIALKSIAEAEGVEVASAGVRKLEEQPVHPTVMTQTAGDETRLNNDETVIKGVVLPPPPPSTPVNDINHGYTPPITDRYDRKPANTGTPVWIWLTIALLVIALGVAGFLVYKSLESDSTPAIDRPIIPEDTEETDNPKKADTYGYEANTKTPTAKSVLPDGYATPDLGFHNLSGPVKSCKNQWGATLPFDREGSWTGNYNDELGPRTFRRDSEGRIVAESYSQGPNGPGTIYYTWDGNNVTTMSDTNRNHEVEFTYNPDGSLATQTIYSNGKYIIYNFSNERRDSHGNWTSRSYRRTSTDSNGNTSTTSGTQKRTISYY